MPRSFSHWRFRASPRPTTGTTSSPRPDGEPCCGGKECAPLAAGDAVEVTGGFLIRSLGITVPYANVQQSPDTHFHACVWWTPKQEVKCFFVPQPAT